MNNYRFMKKQWIIFLGISSFLLAVSCGKNNGSVKNISANGQNKSHNMGKNCMQCHVKGGEGEGWFVVAGTVYDSLQNNTYPNTTIKLYTGPNGSGTLKYTIEGDQKGNFFSTETMDVNGLYAAVTGNNGTHYMGSALSTGACNSCHGVSTQRIWTK